MEDQISNIEQLIRQGRYLEAKSITTPLLKSVDGVRVKQLYSLALSKSGMPELARDILEELYHTHPDDAETAGILGGIYKVLFRQTEDSKFAILSRDTYLKNFSITNSYYTGINAATMSAVAGQARKGREIAKEVIERIDKPNDFWELATLGEAYLLSKDYGKSVEHYLEARKQAVNDWGKIGSVFNQLWLIKHYMHVPSDIFDIFSPPTVMTFVGHMIDHPNRSTPRFPKSIINEVKTSISNAIKSSKAAIGYCSLACGGDILFAEAMEEAGGELNIFLPFKKEDFISASVAFAGEEWINRFEGLLSRHPVTYITQEPFDNYADLFTLQTNIIFGTSIQRSSLMHSQPILLSLLSKLDIANKPGGTRDNVSLWPLPENRMFINPDDFLSGHATKANSNPDKLVVPRSSTIVRPALYLLAISLDQSIEPEWDAFRKNLLEKIDEASITVMAMMFEPGYAVAGFKSLYGLIEFIQFIKQNCKRHSRLLLSIYAGPVHLDEYVEKAIIRYRKMSGHHVELLRSIHAYSIPGTTIVASPISAEFALTKTPIEFLSRFMLKEGEVTCELYRVLI